MSLSDDTAFPRWGTVRVRPRFPDAPSGCQPGRSPMRSEEEVERPGDGCPCVGAEEICGVPPLLSEGRNEGEHRGNHDGGSAGCARHGLDLLIPGRWGRRRCSGCPGRPQHREGRRAARWVVCSDSAHLGTQPCCGGLRVAKRAEHPGFHVIGVMAVKCPLTGVLSDQVGDYGFTAAEKDGVLA